MMVLYKCQLRATQEFGFSRLKSAGPTKVSPMWRSDQFRHDVSMESFNVCSPSVKQQFLSSGLKSRRSVKLLHQVESFKTNLNCQTRLCSRYVDLRVEHERKFYKDLTSRSIKLLCFVDKSNDVAGQSVTSSYESLSQDSPTRREEQTAEESSSHGTVLGAVALITGTSVGAGILALPAVTAPVGFVPSAVTMGVSWFFLLLEALLLAEVNVTLLQGHLKGMDTHSKSKAVSLCAMAEETLGTWGGVFAAVTYLFLSYTIMVAYIAKSGDVLSLMLHIPSSVAGLVFTLLFASLVLIGGTKMADHLNQILTAGLIGLFMLIIVGGSALGNWSGLQHMDWAIAPQTFPVIFFSLVYHDLLPVLCMYLDGDISRIRLSIVLGSVVPLFMFLSWDAVALCLTPIAGGEDPLNFLIRMGGSGPSLIIEIFSLLAVATSLIGSLLGFTEFFLERLSGTPKFQTFGMKAGIADRLLEVWSLLNPIHISEPPKEISFDSAYDIETSNNEPLQPYVTKNWVQRVSEQFHGWWVENSLRTLSFTLVLGPSLAASIIVTDAFFSATDLAGSYGMTTLYGVFPPAMAWSLYQQGPLQTTHVAGSIFGKAIPGGRAVLAGIGLCAFGIVLSQLLLDVSQWSPNIFVDNIPATSGHDGLPDPELLVNYHN